MSEDAAFGKWVVWTDFGEVKISPQEARIIRRSVEDTSGDLLHPKLGHTYKALAEQIQRDAYKFARHRQEVRP